jgi:polysaccharide export outer membrane protein
MRNRPTKWARRYGRVAVASVCLWSSLALAQDYQLQTGDVIAFAVIGYPEMQKRAVVDQSGTIVLPVLGRLSVRGKTLEDVRRHVIEVLKPKSFRRLSSDGNEVWGVFYPDQIMVDIDVYRPVYVDGDIASPGAQTYTPGMTVRQAIAGGGGYQVAYIENPELKVAELRGRFDILRAKYQESEIKVASIRAQLAGDKTVTATEATDPSLASRRQEAIQQEQSRVEALDADQAKERASIEFAMTKAAERMKYLVEQQESDQRGADLDEAELARVKALFEKGVAPITRVNDAQRAVLLSGTRALQTNAEVAQLQREQGELQRNLEKLTDQRRIALLAELQTESGAMTQMAAEMAALAIQIRYVQGLRTDLVDQEGRPPTISLARTNGGKTTTIAATEDTVLSPGDTITISLQLNQEAP